MGVAFFSLSCRLSSTGFVWWLGAAYSKVFHRSTPHGIRLGIGPDSLCSFAVCSVMKQARGIRCQAWKNFSRRQPASLDSAPAAQTAVHSQKKAKTPGANPSSLRHATHIPWPWLRPEPRVPQPLRDMLALERAKPWKRG